VDEGGDAANQRSSGSFVQVERLQRGKSDCCIKRSNIKDTDKLELLGADDLVGLIIGLAGAVAVAVLAGASAGAVRVVAWSTVVTKSA